MITTSSPTDFRRGDLFSMTGEGLYRIVEVSDDGLGMTAKRVRWPERMWLRVRSFVRKLTPQT